MIVLHQCMVAATPPLSLLIHFLRAFPSPLPSFLPYFFSLFSSFLFFLSRRKRCKRTSMRSTGRVGTHCGTAMSPDCSPSSLTRWQNFHPVQRVLNGLTSLSSPLPHSLSLHLTLSPLPHSDSLASSSITLFLSYSLTPPCISISHLSFVLILPISIILILICLLYNSP